MDSFTSPWGLFCLGVSEVLLPDRARRRLWPSASLCQHAYVSERRDPYYRHDLALVHHRGFAFHASACAPGILDLLAPLRANNGVVLEVGCGTGLLTKELIAAGHRSNRHRRLTGHA